MSLYYKKGGSTHKIAYTMPSAYPASNTTFDNTGTGMSATTVQNALTELNSNLSANTLGTQVDLKAYTYESKYTFPKDGYVIASTDNTVGSTAVVNIYDKNGVGLSNIVARTSTANAPVSLVTYVKAGMQGIGSGITALYKPLS